VNTLNRWLGLVVLPALLAAAACGGSSGTLTKAEFIEQADNLCGAANDELDALPEPKTPEELRTALDKGVSRTRKLLSDLRALNEPEADEQALEEIYSLVERSIAKLDEADAAFATGNVTAVDGIVQAGQGLLDQANAASKTYGFKDCSE
jgi:hypothetical protein